MISHTHTQSIQKKLCQHFLSPFFLLPPSFLFASLRLLPFHNNLTQDQTRYVWMYEDGNYHDAELDAMQDDPIIQHDIRTGDYVQPKLGYFPYHGPHVTSLLIEAVKIGKMKTLFFFLIFFICVNIFLFFFHFCCCCCCCCCTHSR